MGKSSLLPSLNLSLMPVALVAVPIANCLSPIASLFL